MRAANIVKRRYRDGIVNTHGNIYTLYTVRKGLLPYLTDEKKGEVKEATRVRG